MKIFTLLSVALLFFSCEHLTLVPHNRSYCFDDAGAVADFPSLIKTYFRTADSDWGQVWAGEYYVENNVWNKRTITQYEQVVGIRKLPQGAVSAGWAWSWPPSQVIVAYPDIVFGKNPWAEFSSTRKLPIRLSEIDSLYVDFDIHHRGSGIRNTAFQIWLTSDSYPQPRHITREVMIWIRNDRLPLAPVRGVREVGGVPYTFSVMNNHSDPNLDPPLSWTYYSFSHPGSMLTGRLDIRAFLTVLLEQGLVLPEEYLAIINLGNEIREGAGITVVRSYKVTVKALGNGKPWPTR